MCFKTIFLFLKVVVFCVCAIGVTRKWSSLNLIFLCSSIHFCNFCNHLISSKKKKKYNFVSSSLFHLFLFFFFLFFYSSRSALRTLLCVVCLVIVVGVILLLLPTTTTPTATAEAKPELCPICVIHQPKPMFQLQSKASSLLKSH